MAVAAHGISQKALDYFEELKFLIGLNQFVYFKGNIMNEQTVIQNYLCDFQVKPGLMSLAALYAVLEFYENYQKFVENEILALHGELTELNRTGQYNSNAVKIEKAKWYIAYNKEQGETNGY